LRGRGFQSALQLSIVEGMLQMGRWGLHMYRAALVLFALITLLPSRVGAQSPVTLYDDVYFQFNSTHVPLLCGFAILGNHGSRGKPHTEWDINVDQITAGGRTIAGISAGVFEVDGGKKRSPKPPITSLVFVTEDSPEPISAKIVGPPNSSNGIRAVLETEPAYRLFKALSDDEIINVNLDYAGGSNDHLIVRGLHSTERGKNSLFQVCLRGHTPTDLVPAPER
jgi:hypothetical protein